MGYQWVLDSTGICPLSVVCDFPGKDLKTQPQCGEFFSLGTPRIASLIFAGDVVLLASLLCDLQNALGHCHHDPINEKKMDGWMDGSSEFLAKMVIFNRRYCIYDWLVVLLVLKHQANMEGRL